MIPTPVSSAGSPPSPATALCSACGPGTWASTGEIYKLELDGTILGKFGHASKELGGFQVVHMMDCRNPNEIVLGEIESWRVQKFVLPPTPLRTSTR